MLITLWINRRVPLSYFLYMAISTHWFIVIRSQYRYSSTISTVRLRILVYRCYGTVVRSVLEYWVPASTFCTYVADCTGFCIQIHSKVAYTSAGILSSSVRATAILKYSKQYSINTVKVILILPLHIIIGINPDALSLSHRHIIIEGFEYHSLRLYLYKRQYIQWAAGYLAIQY